MASPVAISKISNRSQRRRVLLLLEIQTAMEIFSFKVQLSIKILKPALSLLQRQMMKMKRLKGFTVVSNGATNLGIQ